MTQKTASNADFDPKHRIIGAIIVVSLAVIFLPMILDQRRPPARPDVDTAVLDQNKPESLANTKIVVVPIEPLKSLDTPRPKEPVNAKSIDTATLASNTPAEKSAHKPSERKAATAAPAAAPKSASIDHGWIVQVGTFANLSNATRLRDKLKTSGFNVDEENITLEGQKAVRLRVGPFQDKPAALKARASIQNDLGVQGVVLAQP